MRRDVAKKVLSPSEITSEMVGWNHEAVNGVDERGPYLAKVAGRLLRERHDRWRLPK